MRAIETEITEYFRRVVYHDVDAARLLEKVHQTRDAESSASLGILEEIENLFRRPRRRVQSDDIHVYVGLPEFVEHRPGFTHATIFREPSRGLGKPLGVEENRELRRGGCRRDGEHVSPAVDKVCRDEREYERA